MNLSLRYREDMKRKDTTIRGLSNQLQHLQEASKRLLALAQQAEAQIPEDIVSVVNSVESLSHGLQVRNLDDDADDDAEPANNGLELLATRASIVLRGNVEPFVTFDHGRFSSGQARKRMRRSTRTGVGGPHEEADVDSRQPQPSTAVEVDYRDVIAWMRSQPSQS